MIEAILAGLLVLALLGWSACLVLFARATLPMANAFRVLLEVDHKFDQRINATLDRYRANTKKVEIPAGKPQMPAGLPANPMVFAPNAPPLIPNFMHEEQPDSGLDEARA